MSTRTATCRCGQLCVECEDEPVRISVCHCLDCQKRSGSAFAAQARWPDAQVTVTGKSRTWVRTADSGHRATYRFCPNCGSTVAYVIEGWPGITAVGYALMARALGTADADFIYPMISQLASATGRGQDADEASINFVLSVISGAAPRDRFEALLAAQMAVVHLAAMTFSRRLAHVDNIQQQDSAQNALNKLMRTYTAQMDALKRYRTGGQQTVKVEHVHVHEGGQAIVGNVETRAGVATKATDQAHAKAIIHAPELEMRSALQAERETVPVASYEER